MAIQQMTVRDGDPYWANVILLLTAHPSIRDASKYSRSLSNTGMVASTEQVLYSPASFKFTADNQEVRVPPAGTSLDLVLDADFTIELWFYRSTVDNTLFNLFECGYSETGGTNTLMLCVFTNLLSLWNAGVSRTQMTSNEINQWVHIAITRQGTTYRLYKNGVKDDVDWNPGVAMAVSITGGQAYWKLASAISATAYVSEVRVTKGVARYTGATYTVPNRSFPKGSA